MDGAGRGEVAGGRAYDRPDQQYERVGSLPASFLSLLLLLIPCLTYAQIEMSTRCVWLLVGCRLADGLLRPRELGKMHAVNYV